MDKTAPEVVAEAKETLRSSSRAGASIQQTSEAATAPPLAIPVVEYPNEIVPAAGTFGKSNVKELLKMLVIVVPEERARPAPEPSTVRTPDDTCNFVPGSAVPIPTFPEPLAIKVDAPTLNE